MMSRNTNASRALLFSSQDVRRLAIERSRARRDTQLLNKDEQAGGQSNQRTSAREFSSYYNSSKACKEPNMATTHQKTVDSSNNHMQTYPTAVKSLRWKPTLETSDEEMSMPINIDDFRKREFICKCAHCVNDRCPAGTARQVKSRFKENIMTFNDQFTMTPTLYDACCGQCTPPLSSKGSDPTSDVAVRDIEHNVHPNNFSPLPTPISYKCDVIPYRSFINDIEEMKDTGVQSEVKYSIKSKYIHSEIINETEDGVQCDNMPEPRKVLYNEGISDIVLNKIPITAERTSPAKTTKIIKTKTKVCVPNDEIPHAHKNKSRFHANCNIPEVKPAYKFENAETDTSRTSPKVERKVFGNQPRYMLRTQPIEAINNQNIRFPRKTLISADKEIENFIDREYPNIKRC